MARAGNMYHRVIFYKRTTVKDSFGAEVDTYAADLETRGEIRWSTGNKLLMADEIFYTKNMELTIRYRPDIDETFRVSIDENETMYEIFYIEEIGRKEALRFTLGKINN
jgi:SPP1 family predicted phage head-tail adaptor